MTLELRERGLVAAAKGRNTFIAPIVQDMEEVAGRSGIGDITSDSRLECPVGNLPSQGGFGFVSTPGLGDIPEDRQHFAGVGIRSWPMANYPVEFGRGKESSLLKRYSECLLDAVISISRRR